MPNSQNLLRYPVLLFQAFDLVGTTDHLVLACDSPQHARNLRSLCYTMRKLLAASPDEGHQQLYANVRTKKFFVDGHSLVIAEPMHYSTHHVQIHRETPQ